MHEIGLAEDILKKALPLAQKMGLKKISALKVLAGETLLIHPDEFEQAFSMVAANTLAKGAKIELTISPLKAACAKCGSEFSGKTFSPTCQKCGSTNINIMS
ncbi:MAG: hydrogenase maturation nickel metallochaperone HypA, partial [Candidatus Margulisiibacteriota bacterium]